MDVGSQQQVNGARAPRPGSPADVALSIIKATAERRIEEAQLADRMDMTRMELAKKLTFPIREGVIKVSVHGSQRYYCLGPNAPGVDFSERQDVDPEPATGEVPGALQQQDQAQRSARALLEHAPADFTPMVTAESFVIPKFLAQLVPGDSVAEAAAPGGAIGADDLADVCEIVREAAGAQAVPPSKHQAREILASAGAMLVVDRIEVAHYSDGRLLLEIDGISCILPPVLAAKLLKLIDTCPLTD